MSDFLQTLLIVFTIFGVSFLLINIRHIVKGEEFRGTCANNNPMLQSKVGECTVCGKKPGEECADPELSK
ncbi:hypothetical protein [Membranihabitans maritimus]|uniref:hypothetical protein n=1 Tax=Membranihabitans maritimus TaxID=2904244 RepID=UPI001F370AC5|nr:hypothetical protein [Membranihabitans maritimus]